MDNLNFFLGVETDDLNALQMGIRTIIVFLSALLMIKIGNKRFLGRTTAFDFLLGIIIGSVLSRAINGNASLFPSIAAGFVLIGIHWLFGAIALRSNFFGKLIKGKRRTIIENGKINEKEMAKAHIGIGDLKMELRSDLNTDELENIQTAYLERSGRMSFIKNSSGAKIVDIKVEEGVQTIRIKFE